MPANFPEIWLGAVKKFFKSYLLAPWLDGIAEIAANVTTINSGSATEKNIIYVPSTTFAPAVLVNNTTYPLNVENYNDTTITLQLDKYQTQVTSLTDDESMGASYDKITEVTKGHVESIVKKKFQKAIHAIAPQINTTATPVMFTTGEAAPDGRIRLTYNDLVAFKALIDATDCDPTGRRLVLCNDHWNDLLLDRANFGDRLINYNEGKVLNLLGFEVYQYLLNPYYREGEKLPFGVVPNSEHRQASIFFQKDNIGKKTGDTKQYFVPSAQNPRMQSNELAYRHYFVAMPYLNTYIGALVSKY